MIADRSSDHDPVALRQLLVGLLAQPSPTIDSSKAAGLERLCRALVADLELSGVTITLMVADGSQALAAASDPRIAALDAVQFDVGEGPSRDAYAVGRPVLVPDLAASDGRWPGFHSASHAHGLAAVHAFPLQQGAVRLGALTCYAAAVLPLNRQEISRCVVYAEVVTRYLIEDGAGGDPGSAQRDFLERDVQIRTEVYQAQGMVMVELQVSLAEALVRMRAGAFAAGVSLNQLAVEIVAGRRSLADNSAVVADPDVPDA